MQCGGSRGLVFGVTFGKFRGISRGICFVLGVNRFMHVKDRVGARKRYNA